VVDRIRSLSENHSILVFFVLTYSISWVAWMPMILIGQETRPLLIAGSFGPTLAALWR